MRVPKEYQKVVYDIKRKAKRFGIKLTFSPSRTVHLTELDEGSGGYFDGEEKELAVAVMKDAERWIKVFLHESCHMDQEFGRTKVPKTVLSRWAKSCQEFWDWIDGTIELDDRRLDAIVLDIIECELDCEHRTLEKIKRYNLSYNTFIYAQEANTYFFSYHYTRKYRKWVNSIYEDDSLTSLAPRKLIQHNAVLPSLELQKRFESLYNQLSKERA